LSDGIKKVFTQAEIYFIDDLGYLSLISAFNCPEIFYRWRKRPWPGSPGRCGGATNSIGSGECPRRRSFPGCHGDPGAMADRNLPGDRSLPPGGARIQSVTISRLSTGVLIRSIRPKIVSSVTIGRRRISRNEPTPARSVGIPCWEIWMLAQMSWNEPL